jgi:glyoxylase I family protein
MKIFHTAITVKSIEESRKFYESIFNLKLRTKGERPELGLTFVMLEDEQGVAIELFETNNKLPLNTDLMNFNSLGIKHIAFAVEDVDKLFERALTHGATVVWKPQTGVTVKRIAFIKDPNGIPIELVEL